MYTLYLKTTGGTIHSMTVAFEAYDLQHAIDWAAAFVRKLNLKDGTYVWDIE